MDNKNLYEDFDWSKLNDNTIKPKIKKILDWIPDDCKTILDVGCGNGAITNVLKEYYDVTAVDRSKTALQYVQTKSILASADNIPLESNNFDMVFSSEMLEHLPDDVLNGTIKELKRLTRKYIFITVPNAENPDKLLIKCPKCGYIYNRPNHLHSFDVKNISELFPEFRIIKTLEFGPLTRYYNKILLNIKRNITPSKSWVPYYWIDKNNRNTFCPKCENKFYFEYKFCLISSIIDITNVIISPKKPYWLFVLLERN